jgi:chaperone BCS1
MTTNHIEDLDNALLRPGRIDMRIQFEMATKAYAKDLFLQIFGTEPEILEGEDEKIRVKHDTKLSDALKVQAQEFAENIPEKELSPAEIQGFLINWKKSPGEAVANAAIWVQDTLATSHRG